MKQIWLIAWTVSWAASASTAQDWADLPVPAKADDGQVWQLQEAFSDDFNYEGKGAVKKDAPAQ